MLNIKKYTLSSIDKRGLMLLIFCMLLIEKILCVLFIGKLTAQCIINEVIVF